ncbi:MAG: hypothetical protein ACJ77A_05600 [Actinomycetota bacterium]
MGAVAVTMLVVPQMASAATPSRFIDTSNNEWTVAVENGVTAWAVDSPAHRYVLRIHVKPSSRRAYVVNPTGTNARVGNIGRHGGHRILAYAVVGHTGILGNWNVAFWDLAHRRKLTVPSNVNTATSAERYPSVSGNHLLFGRGPKSKRFSTAIYLYTFSSHTLRKIASAPRGGSAFADRVNGDFATYTLCPSTLKCHVFRYRISTRGTLSLPNGGRADYYSTVDSNGNLYYVEGSPSRCGFHTELRRWHAGTSRKLTGFANGIEIGPTYVHEVPGTDRLFFTRIKCGTSPKEGIWKIAA